MKRSLLFSMLFVLLGNCGASAHDGSTSTITRIIDSLLIDKKLTTSIASLRQMIADIQEKNVKYLYTKVVADYWVGNTHRIEKEHWYSWDDHGVLPYEKALKNLYDFHNPHIIARYEQVLKNLGGAHAQVSFGDGALIGCFISILSKALKCNGLASSIGLVLLSALLAVAKNKKMEYVPYLSFPELKPQDNYFTPIMCFGTFLYMLSGGVISYFGTKLVIDRVSDKISAFDEAVKAN